MNTNEGMQLAKTIINGIEKDSEEIYLEEWVLSRPLSKYFSGLNKRQYLSEETNYSSFGGYKRADYGVYHFEDGVQALVEAKIAHHKCTSKKAFLYDLMRLSCEQAPITTIRLFIVVGYIEDFEKRIRLESATRKDSHLNALFTKSAGERAFVNFDNGHEMMREFLQSFEHKLQQACPTIIPVTKIGDAQGDRLRVGIWQVEPTQMPASLAT